MTERDTGTADRPAGDEPSTNAHIRVPAGLRQQIEPRLAETEFESVDEYATFILEAVLREIDERDDRDPRDDDTATDADDAGPVNEAAVQDRLESLGYL